jgi:DNA-binding transcriptional LysR family regulator
MSRLEGFYWVGRVGGYSAAARAMPYPISQPAVYQQVRKLELELECRLFERVGRGQMRLTPSGERLYEFVRPFFDGLPGTIRAIRANEFGGTIRIYAASKFIVELLPDWLRRVRENRPDIRIELFETEHPDTTLLETSEADMIVDFFGNVIGPEFHRKQIARTYGCVVVPDALADKMNGQLDVKLLSKIPFVGYHPNLLHADLQAQSAHQLGLSLQPVASVESVEAILALVQSGIGYSLIASLEPNGPKRAGITCFQPPSSDISFPIQAVWHKRKPEHPLVAEMLKYSSSAP